MSRTALSRSPSRSPAKKASQSQHIRSLWSIPGVPATATSVFCLKFVRYCMYMWLPLYLIEHLGYPKVYSLFTNFLLITSINLFHCN